VPIRSRLQPAGTARPRDPIAELCCSATSLGLLRASNTSYSSLPQVLGAPGLEVEPPQSMGENQRGGCAPSLGTPKVRGWGCEHRWSCRCPCALQGMGPHGLWRSLPTPTILWFYDVTTGPVSSTWEEGMEQRDCREPQNCAVSSGFPMLFFYKAVSNIVIECLTVTLME